MKTWTNPTVEELDVELTANGRWNVGIERLIPGVDLPILGDGSDDKVEPNPDPVPPVVEPEKPENEYDPS